MPRKMVWLPAENDIWVNALYEEFKNNRCGPGGVPNDVAKENIVQKFQARFDKNIPWYPHMKYKLDTLKKDHRDWSNLASIAGFKSVDRLTGRIEAPSEWWDERLKENVKLKRFKDQDFKFFPILDEIFGSIMSKPSDARKLPRVDKSHASDCGIQCASMGQTSQDREGRDPNDVYDPIPISSLPLESTPESVGHDQEGLSDGYDGTDDDDDDRRDEMEAQVGVSDLDHTIPPTTRTERRKPNPLSESQDTHSGHDRSSREWRRPRCGRESRRRYGERPEPLRHVSCKTQQRAATLNTPNRHRWDDVVAALEATPLAVGTSEHFFAMNLLQWGPFQDAFLDMCKTPELRAGYIRHNYKNWVEGKFVLPHL